MALSLTIKRLLYIPESIFLHYTVTIRSVEVERPVDGQYTNLAYWRGQCAKSELKQTAEWRVDLGAVKSIHYVFIQYATYNEVWGIVFI